ncbi:MAG: hypothetical protein AAF467_26535 [Actinomycetota bacterium]
MESDPERSAVGRSPQSELDEIRRSSERPHLEYPPIPIWVWPVLAVASGTYTWSFSVPYPIPGLPMMVAGIGLTWWVVTYMVRTTGVLPSFSSMPRPLKRQAIFTWAQVLVLVPIVYVVSQLIGAIGGAVFASAAFTAISYVHQRRHEQITARLRAANAGPTE